MGSESEKKLLISLPCMSFLNLCRFLPKDTCMELPIKATRSNCLKITCIMMNVMNDRYVNGFLFQ